MNAPAQASPATPTAAAVDLPRGPFRLAAAMVATTVLLISFGAMVTSTGSGMAFVDWPLSDGELMPTRALTTLDAFLEHFHRVIGAAVGLMILGLTVWVARAAGDRPGLRWLCIAGLCLTVVQGIVGGTGVLNNLPTLNSVTHGVLAQVTLATFAVIAFALTPGWFTAVATDPGKARTGRRMVVTALVLLMVQLTLGAVARHTGNAHALWTHVGFALVVFLALLIAAGYTAGRLGHLPGVGRWGRWVMHLLVLQVMLGFVALFVRMDKHPENIQRLWRASLISAHVLTGALLVLVTTLLGAQVFRGTRRPAEGGRG